MRELNLAEAQIVSGGVMLDILTVSLSSYAGTKKYDLSTTIKFFAGLGALGGPLTGWAMGFGPIGAVLMIVPCAIVGALEANVGYEIGASMSQPAENS